MTTIAETGAQWLVITSECDCGHVAVTVMETRVDDPNASAKAEHDHEVVTYGDDWRELARQAATELHNRTGKPISAMCTVVFTQEKLKDHNRGKWLPFDDEVSDFMDAEFDTRGE